MSHILSLLCILSPYCFLDFSLDLFVCLFISLLILSAIFLNISLLALTQGRRNVWVKRNHHHSLSSTFFPHSSSLSPVADPGAPSTLSSHSDWRNRQSSCTNQKPVCKCVFVLPTSSRFDSLFRTSASKRVFVWGSKQLLLQTSSSLIDIAFCSLAIVSVLIHYA